MTATVALGPLMNDKIMFERDGLEREREGLRKREREGLRMRMREREIEIVKEGERKSFKVLCKKLL